MRLLIVLSLLCLSHSTSFGQVGFLGNRTTLSAGVSIPPPVNSGYQTFRGKFGDNSMTLFSEWSVLPPELSLNASFVLSERIQFESSIAFNGLKNVGFKETSYDLTGADTRMFIDSFLFKTNVLDVGLNFKIFSEYAPIGRYVELGGGMSHVNSKVYPTFIEETELFNSDLVRVTTDKREPAVFVNNILYANAGVGMSRMISEKMIIDYGIRTSYYFGPRKFDPEHDELDSEFNYEDYFSDIAKFIQALNLRNSYGIELYVKFGFIG